MFDQKWCRVVRLSFGGLRIASGGGAPFGNIGFSGGGGLTPHGNGSLSGVGGFVTPTMNLYNGVNFVMRDQGMRFG